MDAILFVAEKTFSAALGDVVGKIMARRQKETLELVLEELRTAKVDPEEAAKRNEFASMMWKYWTAMAQGAAFRNLRIIAKILAGKTADPKLRTDDFIMWADVIAGLTHEETVFLATLIRKTFEVEAEGIEAAGPEAWNRTRATLVGSSPFFQSDEDIDECASALLRTGFVISLGTWDMEAMGATSRLRRLAQMATLDAWADDTL